MSPFVLPVPYVALTRTAQLAVSSKQTCMSPFNVGWDLLKLNAEVEILEEKLQAIVRESTEAKALVACIDQKGSW